LPHDADLKPALNAGMLPAATPKAEHSRAF
jgi:hypothetical protein